MGHPMNISVERFSFFQGPQGTLRFVETSPPATPHVGSICTCTTDVHQRPAGRPHDVVQTLRFHKAPVLGKPDGVLEVELQAEPAPYSLGLQWRFKWGPLEKYERTPDSFGMEIGPDGEFYKVRPSAYFYFSAREHHVNLQVSLPGYGLTGCFFADVYLGNRIDISRFFNGHSPSEIVDLGKIGEGELWLHQGRFGAEAVASLSEGEDRDGDLEEEAGWWRATFGQMVFLAERAAPLIADVTSSVDQVRERLAADLDVLRRVERVYDWLESVVLGLEATKLYKVQKGLDDAELAVMKARAAEPRAPVEEVDRFADDMERRAVGFISGKAPRAIPDDDDLDLDAPLGEPGDGITLREILDLSDELAAHPERNPVTLGWAPGHEPDEGKGGLPS